MTGVEIHVFDCGQGDTIFLRLPGNKHALIDCNLPDGPTRTQFFQFLETWAVRHLDLLCLTHPHDDHYHGMLEVVEYFASEGRTLGTFCDVGVTPKEVLALMTAKNRPPSYITEYSRLYSRLNSLIKENKVRYFAGNQDSRPLIRSTGLYLMPIGPDPTIVRQMLESSMRRDDRFSSIREDLNLLSLVLVLRMHGDIKGDALLVGDTNGAGVNKALQVLTDHDHATPCQFDFVKVAHHGSLDSHRGSNICSTRRTTGTAIAAISTGSDYKVLPDREVLSDFINASWRVLITTKRVGKPQQDRVLTLASRNKPDPFLLERNTIVARWTQRDSFTWSPVRAEVTRVDLGNYGSARDN